MHTICGIILISHISPMWIGRKQLSRCSLQFCPCGLGAFRHVSPIRRPEVLLLCAAAGAVVLPAGLWLLRSLFIEMHLIYDIYIYAWFYIFLFAINGVDYDKKSIWTAHHYHFLDCAESWQAISIFADSRHGRFQRLPPVFQLLEILGVSYSSWLGWPGNLRAATSKPHLRVTLIA